MKVRLWLDWLNKVDEETRLLKEEEDWSNECNTDQMNQKNDCYGMLNIKAEELKAWRVNKMWELHERKPSKVEDWIVICICKLKL